MDFEDIGDAFDRRSFVSYARTRAAEQEERDPVVGDIVHLWHAGEGRCQPALVLRADDTQHEFDDDLIVTLRVFTPQGDETAHAVLHDEKRSGGTWHWPEA